MFISISGWFCCCVYIVGTDKIKTICVQCIQALIFQLLTPITLMHYYYIYYEKEHEFLSFSCESQRSVETSNKSNSLQTRGSGSGSFGT